MSDLEDLIKKTPQALNSKEYKFLLKGEMFFDPVNKVKEFWQHIVDLAEKLSFELLSSGIPWEGRRRDVYYLDTEEHNFRNKHYILRIRQKFDGELARPYYEIGCKFRHQSLTRSAQANVDLNTSFPQDLDLEEDLILTNKREFISFFSLRNRLKKYSGPLFTTVGEASMIFPILGKLAPHRNLLLNTVNNLIISERKYTPGLLQLSKKLTIEPTISIWYQFEKSEPLVAEFSFKHAISSGVSYEKLASESFTFFSRLHKELNSWLAEGTSKTNFTYRHPIKLAK